MTIQNGLALVADIGGTNARFALCEHDKLLTDTIKVFPCKEYDNLDGAVTAYLDSQNASVDEACMAFACPVSSGRINMINNHWDFERSSMQQKLGLKTFKVINDFTAQALALPALCGSELVKIGGGEAIEDAAKLIIGPGTGLGVTGLKSVINHWLPLPGEGGHAAYSPVSKMDSEVLAELQKEEPFISWENVLCGSGLETLYRAHSQLAGENSDRKESLKDYEITRKALEGDALCKQVLNHFCELLGRQTAAGNAGLTIFESFRLASTSTLLRKEYHLNEDQQPMKL